MLSSRFVGYMDDVEKSKKELLELLKSIETPDDLKKHEKDIIAGMETVANSGVAELKRFVEHVDSMSKEEIEKEFPKFADGDYLMDPKIDEEITRIENVPGAEDINDSFNDEDMDRRLGPIMNEYESLMKVVLEKFAKNFLDEFMGPILDGIEEFGENLMGEMIDGFENEDEDGSEDNKKNIDEDS